MKHILPILLFFLSSSLYAQQGGIIVDIEAYTYGLDNCYHLTLFQGSDTVYFERITNEEKLYGEGIIVDSLEVGNYLVSLESCGEPNDELFQSAAASVTVRENQYVTVYFSMNHYPVYSDIDEETREEIVKERMEFQSEYSYFDFRWNPDGNNPKFNFGIAGAGYTWISFSKHVGFLLGGGFGWNLAQLQIDEQIDAAYPGDVKSNYYNYFYGKYDMKLRFSLLNQQKSDLDAHNIFLDVGAAYQLPLYFKRVTRFNVNDKLVNSFIHRFNDVRLYANFGVTNFQVFASYRPFDFIKGDLPQFPRYDLGVRFNFHD